tara:strand:- start:2836 stop:3039 length:204 start_codon:yes stop_codon:yes gene_type:complete
MAGRGGSRGGILNEIAVPGVLLAANQITKRRGRVFSSKKSKKSKTTKKLRKRVSKKSKRARKSRRRK